MNRGWSLSYKFTTSSLQAWHYMHICLHRIRAQKYGPGGTTQSQVLKIKNTQELRWSISRQQLEPRGKLWGQCLGRGAHLRTNLPTVPAPHLLTHKLIRAPGISAKCRIIHVVASCGGALFTDGRLLFVWLCPFIPIQSAVDNRMGNCWNVTLLKITTSEH